VARVVLWSLWLMVLLAVRPAHGWAELGHQLVGELATPLLTPEARHEVETLLEGEAVPTLAGVAYWADALRTNDPERFRATSRRHYVALAAGSCAYDAGLACPNGECVVAAIQEHARVLGDRTQPREARRDALKFLVHFVGDVHQPLHASDRPDRGGNTFQVSLRTSIPPEAYARAEFKDGIMGTNLHAVWDYYVLASAGRPLDAYARDLRDRAAPANAAAPLEPARWASESCRLIERQQLYPARHVMDHAYLDAMRPLAEARVVVAAERLARLINQQLPAAADPAR
jgi:nuclease S1